MSADSTTGRDFGFVTYLGKLQEDEATRKFVRQNARFHASRSKKESNERRALALPHILKAKKPTSGPSNPAQRDAIHISGNRSSSSTKLDKTRELQPEILEIYDSEEENEKMQQIVQSYFQINDRLGAGRFDPFIKFPISLNHERKKYIDYIFRDPVGRMMPHFDEWLHMALTSRGAFHQMLCLSSTYLGLVKKWHSLPIMQEYLKKAPEHHSTALRVVSKQIQDVITATGDDVISAVISFACYYHMMGNMKAWKSHVLGLKEIIRLRGGFDTVFTNEKLTALLISVDLPGCCDFDMIPNFPFPQHLVPRVTMIPPAGIIDLYRYLIRTANPNPKPTIALIETINRLMQASMNLHFDIARTDGRIYNDRWYLWENITPNFHSLLSLSSEEISPLFETLRLSCILYGITIRFSFRMVIGRGALQLEKLKVIAETWEESGLLGGLRRAGLGWLEGWVLAMGMLVGEKTEGMREWYEGKFEKALRNMGWTMERFEDTMKEFLWVEDIHSAALKRIKKS